MSRKVKTLLFIFSAVYLLFHFYTLDLNPIPWFDEVYFASISKTFLETGKFVPTISKEMWKGQELLIHGPVHFLFGSMSFGIFGFGILQYRSITFIFGILTLLATASLLKIYYPSSKNIWLLLLLFALDPFFQLSLHEGRMDLTATFFMLSGIWFLLKGIKNKNNWFFIASGAMIAVSLLTTPRMGFIFIAVLLVFLVSLEGKIKRGSLFKLAYWGLPLLVFYGLWIFYKFGNIQNFFDYYQEIRSTKAEYIGGRLYIPRQEYLLILLTGISMLYGIFRKGLSYFNELVIISILSIILFYIIVLDWGPYSMLILPFYYFLLFHGFSDLQLSWKNPAIYALLLIFTQNITYSSVKASQIFSERRERSNEDPYKFIRENIPAGSKVIGDGSYYYAVIEAGSDYRLYQEFLTLEEREELLREEFDYDYMIVTRMSKDKQPEIPAHYHKNSTLLKVAEFKTEQNPFAKKIASLRLVSNMEWPGYSAELYVRVKKDMPGLALIPY